MDLDFQIKISANLYQIFVLHYTFSVYLMFFLSKYFVTGSRMLARDILIESEVIAAGSINGVLSGHQYNRSIDRNH